jgi:hypothetical protein
MKQKIWLIALTLFIGLHVPGFNAQPHFTCTLINDSLTAPNVYEFDIYIYKSTIELADINFGFLYNTQVQDKRSMRVSRVPNSFEKGGRVVYFKNNSGIRRCPVIYFC